MPLLYMGASPSPQAVQQVWLHGHHSLLDAAVRQLEFNVIIALLTHCVHGSSVCLVHSGCSIMPHRCVRRRRSLPAGCGVAQTVEAIQRSAELDALGAAALLRQAQVHAQLEDQR